VGFQLGVQLGEQGQGFLREGVFVFHTIYIARFDSKVKGVNRTSGYG
jgi:hypothetical protein